MNNFKQYFAAFLVTISAQAFADPSTVYFKGDILTMEGDKPRYLEAVVVKDGKFAFTSNLKDAMSQAGVNAVPQDLKWGALLPGFIDSWGHFTLIAQNTLGG